VDRAVQVVILVVLLAWLPGHNYRGLALQYLNWIAKKLSSGWRPHVSTS